MAQCNAEAWETQSPMALTLLPGKLGNPCALNTSPRICAPLLSNLHSHFCSNIGTTVCGMACIRSS